MVVHVSPEPSGDLPFLPSASRAPAQRRKRSVPYGQGGVPGWGMGTIPNLGFSRWLLLLQARIHLLGGPRSEGVGMEGTPSDLEPVHPWVLDFVGRE